MVGCSDEDRERAVFGWMRIGYRENIFWLNEDRLQKAVFGWMRIDNIETAVFGWMQ